MTDENTQLTLNKFEEKFSILEAEIKDLRANQDKLTINQEELRASQEKLALYQEVFFKISEGYQRAADRLANLAFTFVGAAAAIAVISPAVKSLAEFAAR
jgi:hypothetical protein